MSTAPGGGGPLIYTGGAPFIGTPIGADAGIGTVAGGEDTPAGITVAAGTNTGRRGGNGRTPI